MMQLKDKKVLVVEDNALIATMAVQMLNNIGVKVIGPAYNVQDALSLASENEIDAAFIDYGLKDENSDAIIQHCRRREIPFALTTGYDEKDIVDFDNIVIITKPYTEEKLSRMLKSFFS